MQMSDPKDIVDTISAPGTLEEKFDRLVACVAQLSGELHTVKGNLAANTSFTKEMIDNQDTLRHELIAGQQSINLLISKIDVEQINVIVQNWNDMRGGIKVLGWLERPAKWFVAISAVVTLTWGWWHK
jgi:hypothetical protein